MSKWLIMTKLHHPRAFAVNTAAVFCGALLLNYPGSALAADEAKIEFPAPSSHSVLKQRVGVTDVEIDYSRPNKNGREIFGGLVPFNAVWRTGANASTKISFSDPVKLGGKDVPAGKYGLYTIPAANEWTVILSKAPDQWGAYDYKQDDDLVRFTVKPMAAMPMAMPLETFTIGFDDVKEGSATLCLAWDRTCVCVPLTVDTAGIMKTNINRTAASAGATPQFYAQAANYYLAHNIELPKALEWINAAIEKTPNEYAYYGRKASIQAKLGDKPGAIASTQKAIELAKGKPGEEEVVESMTKLANSLR